MKLEVSPLQLAEWLIHGIAVIIALMQVDSVNDLTLRPIPRAPISWGTGWQHSRGTNPFLSTALTDWAATSAQGSRPNSWPKPV